MGGTEGDNVIGGGASEGAGGVVVGVAVRLGTRALEHLRVHRWLARRRRSVLALAAVLRSVESVARAAARASVLRPQLGRAFLVQVLDAAGGGALTRAAADLDQHWQVVAVDEADVVEVHGAGAEGELGQSGSGGASAVALQLAGAAVAGGAGAVGRVIEVAAGSAPEAAGPAGRQLEGARTAFGELESGCLELRRAQNCRPNCL